MLKLYTNDYITCKYITKSIIWMQTNIYCRMSSSCSEICPCVFCASLQPHGWVRMGHNKRGKGKCRQGFGGEMWRTLANWKTGVDENNWRIKNQLDATSYFIVLLIGSTCFGHYCAHRQELVTMMLFITLVVSFLVCCMLEVMCS